MKPRHAAALALLACYLDLPWQVWYLNHDKHFKACESCEAYRDEILSALKRVDPESYLPDLISCHPGDDPDLDKRIAPARSSSVAPK